MNLLFYVILSCGVDHVMHRLNPSQVDQSPYRIFNRKLVSLPYPYKHKANHHANGYMYLCARGDS